MSATEFVWAVEHPTRGKAHQVNWLDGRRLPARCGEIPSGDWRGYKAGEPHDGRLCVRCRDLSLMPDTHTCGGPDSACDADCMTEWERDEDSHDQPRCACRACGCTSRVEFDGERCGMCSEACVP